MQIEKHHRQREKKTGNKAAWRKSRRNRNQNKKTRNNGNYNSDDQTDQMRHEKTTDPV